jgi:hypothetical protein
MAAGEMRRGFPERAAGYIDALQLLIRADYANNYPNLTPPRVMMDHGQKYNRVFLAGSQNMAHTFLDQETGDVLKAKSWKGPDVKHPRSNIFADDYGMSGVTAHGARYL